jgi:large conductance mechanosensitive channel
MKKLIQEFKEFAARGNVIDLAVAVILGNAINKIVTSLVNDIFMPVLSIFIGRIDLSSLSLNISSRFIGAKPISIGFGSFLQAVLNFLTIAFCIFIILKMLNKLRNFRIVKSKHEQKEEAVSAPPSTEELLIEIRDLLKKHSEPEKTSNLPENFEENH